MNACSKSRVVKQVCFWLFYRLFFTTLWAVFSYSETSLFRVPRSCSKIILLFRSICCSFLLRVRITGVSMRSHEKCTNFVWFRVESMKSWMASLWCLSLLKLIDYFWIVKPIYGYDIQKIFFRLSFWWSTMLWSVCCKLVGFSWPFLWCLRNKSMNE